MLIIKVSICVMIMFLAGYMSLALWCIEDKFLGSTKFLDVSSLSSYMWYTYGSISTNFHNLIVLEGLDHVNNKSQTVYAIPYSPSSSSRPFHIQNSFVDASEPSASLSGSIFESHESSSRSSIVLVSF